ncbi:MAG: nucleotidyltransferase substrate binding protein [Candidatus Scalindua sp.]
MNKDQRYITEKAFKDVFNAIGLVEASLSDLPLFEVGKDYTPKQREPYDALSDRFIRSVEISIKFFRCYEKLMYGENSDTLRDVLNKMEKLNLISSVILWMQMRDVRNRIVHDYLPEVVAEIYRSIAGEFATELSSLKRKEIHF